MLFDFEDDLLPYRARVAMLNHQHDVAIRFFEDCFSDDARLEQVIISSIYLDYGTALNDVGRIEDALLIWDQGLQSLVAYDVGRVMFSAMSEKALEPYSENFEVAVHLATSLLQHGDGDQNKRIVALLLRALKINGVPDCMLI